MQLHVYDLSAVKHDLEARDFGSPYCLDEPAGSDFTGTLIFARRAPPDRSRTPAPLRSAS